MRSTLTILAEIEFIHTSTPVLPRKHVDCRYQTEYDVQDTSRPDELLGEGARKPNIAVAQDDGNSEAEGEENDRVRGKTKVILAPIDSSRVEVAVFDISRNCDARHSDEACEYG
jgi:hypothetical protein